MHRLLIFLCWALLGLAGSSCLKPYEPAIIAGPNRYLVVDGHINGRGVTTVRLAYSINLDSPDRFPPESGAQVYIEDDRSARYPLREAGPGRYVSATLALPAGRSYHLRIITRERQEYASDLVVLPQTPPYDKLAATLQPDGLQVYLNTHDDSGNIQHYRWEYDETWEFTSAFESIQVYKKPLGRVLPRKENIYRCWRTENAATVKTFSTVRLTQAAVRDYRLLFVPRDDIRLRHLYSLNVRQYALSRPEFDYWEAVKKNTDNLGTLFDPLPSQIQGNVHSLYRPDEPVLGFVGASTVTEQRIFVRRQDLPVEWTKFINKGYEHCVDLDTFPSRRYLDFTYDDFFGDSTYRMPVARLRPGEAYTASTQDCVDCRLRGTNVKPDFWPQ
ncbi:hypothetical protein CDA63_03090 [Hymenobacter amundsenii]|uniref:DUF4249 domain-containing protein n=1 Tax=Hymenobacter amundsenii TaxID=2006685 RepID=A0A246FQ02_9BACT|nr:DUF4249 domain-containing protein [Hymenobacter amundsenii]OWP64759.1 hypothetical protein CDA63_03090 [Hymenobacter amundsenii]